MGDRRGSLVLVTGYWTLETGSSILDNRCSMLDIGCLIVGAVGHGVKIREFIIDRSVHRNDFLSRAVNVIGLY